MPVRGVVLLHDRVLRRVLGIFLHVMRLRVRHHTCCGNGVAHMTGKVYAALAASHFPRAAVISGEHELIGAIALGQASRYRSYTRLCLPLPSLTLPHPPSSS